MVDGVLDSMVYSSNSSSISSVAVVVEMLM